MVHIKIYFKNEERKSFSGSLCWWNGTQFLITAQVPASFYFSDRHPRGYILADAIQGKVVQTRCGPSRTSGLRAHCLPARQPFQALSVAASLSWGDGALRWQVAHMTGSGFLQCVSVCPQGFLTLLTPSQEDLRPRLGPSPSAPVSVARKVLCQSGSPGIGQQQEGV